MAELPSVRVPVPVDATAAEVDAVLDALADQVLTSLSSALAGDDSSSEHGGR